jgi:hypothetical protein
VLQIIQGHADAHYQEQPMKIRILTIAMLATACFSLDAMACGDSLYRVGTGVSYRVYTAPLPGSVLVYGQSEAAKQLAEELARSGHGVRLVGSSEELESELQTGKYDVVIAAYSDHSAVESTAAGVAASQATFIPVAQTDEEEQLAKQNYDRVMLAQKDEIKHYLKAIHQTLKAKT